jgi:hypothetical protein
MTCPRAGNVPRRVLAEPEGNEFGVLAGIR